MSITFKNDFFFKPLSLKYKRVYYDCIQILIERTKELPVLYESDARDSITLYLKNMGITEDAPGEDDEGGMRLQASDIMALFRKCGWLLPKEIGRNGEYVANMELIDSRINKYYNLANTRIMLMAGSGVRLESAISDFLNSTAKLPEEERDEAMERAAGCLRVTSQKYVGAKSFVRNRRARNEGANIGLAAQELTEAEKRAQTEELFAKSVNRYSIERVSAFLRERMGGKPVMHVKDQEIQTREEALMFAAAMLYANDAEFPYDIELSEEMVRATVADITGMSVRARRDGDAKG